MADHNLEADLFRDLLEEASVIRQLAPRLRRNSGFLLGVRSWTSNTEVSRRNAELDGVLHGKH
jgi:hypothetical protein